MCINFYLALLQPEGDMAERFWAEELGPTIQSQFDVFTPFDTAEIDTLLVYQRVAELTGVELTEESVASFDSEQPFVQLRSIHPVMKVQRVPKLVETVGEGRSTLLSKLEELFLFGVAEDDETAKERFEPSWPLYFKESKNT